MSPGTDRPWNSAFQPDRGLGAFHSLRKAILAQRTQLGLDALKQCDEVLRTARVSEILCNRLMSDTVAENWRHHEQD
ncbi:hypothetical protein C2127_25460, partial [Pseudomonas aeruginosa]